MDTRELKNLLQEQPSTTSLTPQSVWNYTCVRRRARQRVATVVTVVALTVGTGLGAVYLNSLSREQRPEIATVPSTPEGSGATQSATEPVPVEESSAAGEQSVEPVEPAPGDEHPDETPPKPGPEPKCVLPMPKSWLDAFEAETAVSSEETVEFLDRGTRVKLVKGDGEIGILSLESANGQETVIDEGVDTTVSGPITDGRFVVYRWENGQLMVWDWKDATNSIKQIEIAMGPSNAMSISNGQLWVTTGKTTPNSGDPVFSEASLYHVNLNSGTSAERVLQGEKFEPLRSLDGRGQVRFMDDRKVRFVDPDGTTEPVVKGYPEYHAVARTGQILVLTEGSEHGPVSLYHSGWGEPIEMIEEGAGSYGGVAEEWLADDNRLHNLFSGVTLEDSNPKHNYGFTVPHRGEVMVTQYTSAETLAEDTMAKSIPLSQLPQEDFTCK